MKMHVHEAQDFAFPNPKIAEANAKASVKASAQLETQLETQADTQANAHAKDVIVRLDKAGFVVDASENAGRLGIDLDAQLLMPHISDLALAQYQRQVSRYLIDVVSGQSDPEAMSKPCVHSVEFPIAPKSHHAASDHAAELDETHEWVMLTLRYLAGEASDDCGLVGTLRTITRSPSTRSPSTPSPSTRSPSNLHVMPAANGGERLSDRFADLTSDPFTGLADRRKFVSSLTSSIAMHENASVALFAIDGMRAVFMQYGQNTADELRWGFARFLEAMVEPHHTLAQVDEERFGVVLPGARPREAREWAADALQTFCGLTASAKGSKPRLSASAGIARAEKSAEWAIRQAELGLVMARAGGGMQTALCRPQPSLSNGRPIEKLMENVVDRAVRGAL